MPETENVYLMSLEALKERLIEREHAVDKMFIEFEKRFQQVLAEMDKRYQQRFEAQETLFSTVADSSKEAINKAEAAQKDKNEMTNEFRGQLADQAVTFMPRKEVEQMNHSFSQRIETLKQDLYVQREEMLKNIAKKNDEMGHEIRLLREAGSKNFGREEQGKSYQGTIQWVITTVLAVGAFMFSLWNRMSMGKGTP